MPFYRATLADPLDLRYRLRHSIEDHEVVAVFEEDFDDPESVAGAGGVPDPLLAALERGRGGQMRDIVATIQAEQDEVIRSPIHRLLVVQGGPGTGKTAVGLHRAAFLLFEHREELTAAGVLVVGPNRTFLTYISQVLPSLGEGAVQQLTLEGLVSPRARAVPGADHRSEELKGSGRMATVVRRLADHAIRVPEEGLIATEGRLTVKLPPAQLAELVGDAHGSTSARNRGRDGFHEAAIRRWVTDWVERHPHDAGDADTIRSTLRRSAGLRRQLDRVWPQQSAPQLLRRLYANRRLRATVCAGVLSDDEQALLARAQAGKVRDEPWTTADLVVLDELEHVLNGTTRSFGHIVVDEAQDLSDMGLRAIVRRCPSRSMTLLGDLAQATAPGCQTDWHDVLGTLDDGSRDNIDAEVRKLELGYRLPAPLLDVASRLLPAAAPHVRPSRSVRHDGRPPRFVLSADLEAEVEAACRELAQRHQRIGVVAAHPTLDRLGSTVRTVAEAHPDTAFEAVPDTLAKGLEFNAVVLAEPSAIVAAHLHGYRVLYIALTRAVHELVVVHEAPLPAALQS